ncbi:hypothetical protein ACQ7HM_05155 [Williamsia sp. MIQD14]|uniref:hypothetical protein n=1 Tax=Williamsia sp. MIQD14 TaxID=3425703 RepID=UPI003DA19569
MNRLGIACVAVIGVVAGAVLTAPTARGDVFGFSASLPGFPYDSSPTAIALGGLLALVVAVVPGRVGIALAGMGAGATVLVVAALLDTPPAIVTAGAGAALGGAVALASTIGVRAALAAIVAGFVVGGYAVPALARIRLREPSTPRRYADYLPSDGSYTRFAGDAVLVIGAGLVVVASVVLAVTLRRRFAEPVERPPVPSVGIAAAATVGGALVFWWFLRWISSAVSDSTGLHTFLGGYVLAAGAVAIAVLTPGRRGLIWLAAVAVVAAHGADGTTANGMTMAVVLAALVAFGAAVAFALSRESASTGSSRLVVVGVVLLTFLTATQFLDGDLSAAIPVIAGGFVVPAVAGWVLTASVRGATPPDGAVVIGALVALPLLTRTTGASVGWTAYTPLTDSDGLDGFGGLSYSAATNTGIISAVVTTAVCAAAAVVLSRRSATTRD